VLTAALGGPVEGDTARRLWSITRGNALYLRQLVDGEREAGRLAPAAHGWRWTGRPRLSPGLQELVGDRIGALSDAEREVLEVLAFGEPLEVPLVVALTDAAAVERVEARGLVQVSGDGGGCRQASLIRCTGRSSANGAGSSGRGGCAAGSPPPWPARRGRRTRCGAPCSPWTPISRLIRICSRPPRVAPLT
jgi:hypothetical protein